MQASVSNVKNTENYKYYYSGYTDGTWWACCFQKMGVWVVSLKWLETYSSESTVGLEQFFKALGFNATLEENARAYFSQKRVYEEDLKTFFVSLKGNA
jgi:hypothetical protein